MSRKRSKTNDGPTIPIPTLRVDNIYSMLEPFFTNRSRTIFRNQRHDTNAMLYYFSAVVDEETEAKTKDFAERLNLLFETFNGARSYLYEHRFVEPRIEACAAPPMRIPLATVQTTGEKLEQAVASVEPPKRFVYVAYVFVEGFDDIGATLLSKVTKKKVDPELYEARRVWINKHIGDIIQAAKEGELPSQIL